jgi:hypothetical protein
MSSQTHNSRTSEPPKEPLIYAPVLRDGPSERDVIQEFGGLSRFTDSQRGQLYSILEISGEDDLDNLDVYRDASDELLIDLPEYLTQEDNTLCDPIENLLDEFRKPTDFLNNFQGRIPVPVLSGTISNPITYHQYQSLYRDISSDFEKVALRLFVRPTALTEDQQEDLRILAETIDSDDIILLDLLEVAQLGSGDQGRETLQDICTLFQDQITVILNAFSSYKGENQNFGPEVARDIAADGFGDFAINYRFPQSVPLGDIDTRIIRQYSPTESRVFEFKGEGYEGAYQELEAWELWDPDHCEFCRRASVENTEHLPFWKRVRMGHYISSALTEEAV